MKLTDEQTKYALERCSLHKECCYCNAVEECGSKKVLTDSVLDLINQKDKRIAELQAKIKRLTKENKQLADIVKMYSEIKLEAIKEVTAEIYNSFVQYGKYDRLHIYEFLHRIDSIEEYLINNLVKELAGTD